MCIILVNYNDLVDETAASPSEYAQQEADTFVFPLSYIWVSVENASSVGHFL